MSYHVTECEAKKFAATNKNCVAKPYPDRHGDHRNNFKPNKNTWGVWHIKEYYWVFVNEFNKKET